MNPGLKEQFLKQIDAVIGHQKAMRAKGQYDDLSGLPPSEYERFIAMALSVMQRIAGSDSIYAKRSLEALNFKEDRRPDYYRAFKLVLGMLEALRDELSAGFLDEVSELLHASVFADFLDMAQHLHDEGYKDPAAVIAGSSLESHLRNLCIKNGISTTLPSSKPKKADLMNAELTKTKAYSELDQKSVTAWLDLRNKAAHGQYTQYNADQVALLILGIRDFIARTPA